MSISTIKTTMETALNAGVTTTAIKWFNSTSHTLDGTVLTSTQISALTVFIEPQIIPISEDREVIGGINGINYEVFFQVSVYTKLSKGSGGIYTIIHELNSLYREQIVNNVICDKVETLGSFEEGEWLVTPVRYKCHLWAS